MPIIYNVKILTSLRSLLLADVESDYSLVHLPCARYFVDKWIWSNGVTATTNKLSTLRVENKKVVEQKGAAIASLAPLTCVRHLKDQRKSRWIRFMKNSWPSGKE